MIITCVSNNKNSSYRIIWHLERGRCSPDPAPVTMAVLPDTLKRLVFVGISVGATAVIVAAICFLGQQRQVKGRFEWWRIAGADLNTQKSQFSLCSCRRGLRFADVLDWIYGSRPRVSVTRPNGPLSHLRTFSSSSGDVDPVLLVDHSDTGLAEYVLFTVSSF